MSSVKDLIPDLDSYRGRYTLLSILVGVALVTFAYLGWNLVNSTSQRQIDNITARTVAAGILADAQTQLNHLENNLQRILNEPVKGNLVHTENTLLSLEQVLLDLTRMFHPFLNLAGDMAKLGWFALTGNQTSIKP